MAVVVAFDRFLMAFSLAVHIGIVSVSLALPVVVVLAEFIGIRRRDVHYAAMARRLSIVLVVLFAIGTASGTLVALELLLLWPKFMVLVGQVAILPLYVEVFAFFLEAIFLGVYIYSWDKFKNRYAHVLVGSLAALGGALSAVLITVLNSFMNTPGTVFDVAAYLKNGTITGVSPLAVFSTPAAAIEVPHVLATTYFAGVFIFAAYMSFMMLRARGQERVYYKKGLYLLFALLVVVTPIAVYTGILSINTLAKIQPEKYAAFEANFVPMANASETIGGYYSNGTIVGALSIPGLQSKLLGNASFVVPGLNQYPKSTWPPLIVHDFFDAMVFLGFGFGLFVLLMLVLLILRKNPFERKLVLYLMMVAGFFAVLLLEMGWFTAEVGRQPWIVYDVMTVSQAANYSSSVMPISAAFVVVYAAIIPFTLLILRRIFRNRPLAGDLVRA